MITHWQDMSKSNTVKAIDSASVHRITSGQVIVDLQTSVKELLENSLDAGATSVEVRFKEYGVSSIEVVDNGSGIAEADHESIGLKHHTSKLTSFAGLSAVLTFGFRGEALSSLCAVCENVVVVTCAGANGEAFRLDLGKDGKIQSKTRAARQRGTTVTLHNLFHPLPVRRRELERNAKREFAKALNLLHAYALVPCAKGVRLSVWNLVKQKKTSLLQTPSPSAASLSANIRALYGPKSTENLVALDLDFDFEPEKSMLKRLGILDRHPTTVIIHGLISKFSPGCGRTSSDRQIIYLNGRPWASAKVIKVLNELYRSFNSNQSPIVVLDFQIPTDAVDINVTPDKRTLFVHSEAKFLEALRNILDLHFSPQRAALDVARDAAATPSQSMNTVVKNVDLSYRETSEEPAIEVAGDELAMAASDSDQDVTRTEPSLQESLESVMVADTDLPLSSDGEEIAVLDSQPMHPTSLVPGSSLAEQAPALGLSLSDAPDICAPAARSDSDHDVSADERDAGNAPPSQTVSCSQRPPSKKRRSDVGPVAVHGRESRDSVSGARRLIEVPPQGTTIVDLAFFTGSKRGPKKPTAQERQKHGSNSRQMLRQSIMGFARSGSQLPDRDRSDEEEMGDNSSDASTSENADPAQSSHALTHDDAAADVEPPSPVPSYDADLGAEKHPVENPGEPQEPSPESSSLGVLDLSSSEPTDVLETDVLETPVWPEVIRTGAGEDSALRFDITGVSNRWKLKRDRRLLGTATRQTATHQELNEVAGVSNVSDDVKAADALSRIIEKQDFSEMDVIGQFNKGFIVVRRRKAHTKQTERDDGIADDLFIIDQHAADEKYNFETLQLTTKFESQRLFRPRVLELTAADELTAIDNLDVLRQNGFELAVNEDFEGSGRRLSLMAQPVSRGTNFDMKDLEELIHIMQERPSGQMVRCSKASAMFAMRACRKSVMVGMPLTKRQMKVVVEHMGNMHQPWNCPHGRPTMRHLWDVTGLAEEPRRPLNWPTLKSRLKLKS